MAWAAAMQFLDVGMIGRHREHARDHAPLLGHAHALLGAQLFQTFQAADHRGRAVIC